MSENFSIDPVRVLERLKSALPDLGIDGWSDGQAAHDKDSR